MAQVTDPVCGMRIDSNSAAGSSSYQGQTYYFCSSDCKSRFDANPKQYVSGTSKSRPDAGDEATF
ncbi:MAG: YHS domain-containing protein [Gemmatimonadaceae bacterium]